MRGEDYVSVVSLETGEEVDRIETAKGPSKVVFSPDGKQAFVDHFDEYELDAIDVATREVSERIAIPDEAATADLAISPDGEEVWLGRPITGKTTVVNVGESVVEGEPEPTRATGSPT